MSDELKPIPVELPPLDFTDFKAMGYHGPDGQLHALSGFHVVEYDDGCFGFEEDT